jgi:hypothetical protein
MRRVAWLWALSSAALVHGLLPGAASAQDVPQRRLGIAWDEGAPRLTFSARDLVNAEVRDKLESGLPQTIVTRVYAYRDGESSPVALSLRSCRVVYDLWEEVFRVQVESPRSDRTYTEDDIAGVLERCVVVRRRRIGSRGDYRTIRGRRVYFAALFELNPLSPDTVERIRRWLARPSGGRVDSDAFFGSFVSLFVNRRIGEAERIVRFRSQGARVPW